MTNDGLHKLWTGNGLELGISNTSIESMWDQLVRRYAESHRRYHTMDHVGSMIQTLSEFEIRLAAPSSVYAAAFFHDAVYDASSSTNEVDSAEVATVFLSDNAVDTSVIETVAALILTTAAHFDETDIEDADWFLDADLAILGAEPERYAWYVAAIREEYASIPDDKFRAGRQRFLEKMLDAEKLFRTDELRGRFESRARANIQRELDLLIAGSLRSST